MSAPRWIMDAQAQTHADPVSPDRLDSTIRPDPPKQPHQPCQPILIRLRVLLGFGSLLPLPLRSPIVDLFVDLHRHVREPSSDHPLGDTSLDDLVIRVSNENRLDNFGDSSTLLSETKHIDEADLFGGEALLGSDEIG